MTLNPCELHHSVTAPEFVVVQMFVNWWHYILGRFETRNVPCANWFWKIKECKFSTNLSPRDSKWKWRAASRNVLTSEWIQIWFAGCLSPHAVKWLSSARCKSVKAGFKWTRICKVSFLLCDSRKIHCLTRVFHIKFHSKNLYRTHRYAVRAIWFFSWNLMWNTLVRQWIFL